MFERVARFCERINKFQSKQQRKPIKTFSDETERKLISFLKKTTLETVANNADIRV